MIKNKGVFMELYKSVVHLPREDTSVTLVTAALKTCSRAGRELEKGCSDGWGAERLWIGWPFRAGPWVGKGGGTVTVPRSGG